MGSEPTEGLSDSKDNLAVQMKVLQQEVEELRIVVRFLVSQTWDDQNKSEEIQSTQSQEVLQKTVERNSAQLQLIRCVLISVLGLSSIFYGALAGVEISRSTEQGQVTFKGSDFLSATSAFAGGVSISILGFAERLVRRKTQRYKAQLP